MKFLYRLFIILLIIAGICIISCPKHEDHSNALKKEVNEFINKEFAGDTEEGDAIFSLTTSLYSGISNVVLTKKLQVDNYCLFSVGRITLDGESEIVSLGIMNHVFTELPDEFKERLEVL